ncbi:MAG: hypothetical protein QX198_10600 [Methylococcaceae bacterium]
MNAKPATARKFELQPAEFQTPTSAPTPQRAELLAIGEDGSLLVRTADSREFQCDWLENNSNANISLEPGDRLLCISATKRESGVVLGRISSYRKPQPQEHVTIEAGESLTLKCGESSVELRSDGRTMLKGEDILLRAKGTQRIRAATVAIN